MVLDFHAPWCGPCRQFESVIFPDDGVEAELADVELIKIDLDKHPQLAASYGVASVPHLLLADRDGRIVARVLQYEGPRTFRRRLEALTE